LDLDVTRLNGRLLPVLGPSAHTPRPNGQERSPAVLDTPLAEGAPEMDGPRRKRRRVSEADQLWEEDDGPWIPQLPPLQLLEAVVEAHFRTVHHWVPILHETRFRAKLKNAEERDRLVVPLHALVSTAIKYVDFEEFGMTLTDVERQIRVSRRVVMLNAMESLSIENTQALIFVAFDYVGGCKYRLGREVLTSFFRWAAERSQRHGRSLDLLPGPSTTSN
jgi:hypothetical protein